MINARLFNKDIAMIIFRYVHLYKTRSLNYHYSQIVNTFLVNYRRFVNGAWHQRRPNAIYNMYEYGSVVIKAKASLPKNY
jgi:hypothetical protein